MAVHQILVRSYTHNIFWYGNRSFEPGSIPAEYHQPVKSNAAATLSEADIQKAYDAGYITKEVYIEVMQIKTPGWEFPAAPEPEPAAPVYEDGINDAGTAAAAEEPVAEASTEPDATV